MVAGVTDTFWEIGDVVKVLEAWEAQERTTGIQAA
jgi:hypothetical protein